MAKFFSAAAVWGRLLLRDIPEGGSWNRGQIAYWDEIYLDSISRLALNGQKIRAVAELDDAIAASRRAPGIRTLWIHEDLLGDTQRRWEQSRETVKAREAVKARWRAPAAIAAAVAAAFVVGLMANERGLERLLRPPVPSEEAARVAAAPPTLRAFDLVKSSASGMARPAAAIAAAQTAGSQTARPRSKAYTVSVGTFESAAAAERMKHLVMRKGFIVVVVRQGAASQVVTPPYRTRTQAERVARGLEGCGIPEQITTWRAP